MHAGERKDHRQAQNFLILKRIILRWGANINKKTKSTSFYNRIKKEKSHRLKRRTSIVFPVEVSITKWTLLTIPLAQAAVAAVASPCVDCRCLGILNTQFISDTQCELLLSAPSNKSHLVATNTQGPPLASSTHTRTAVYTCNLQCREICLNCGWKCSNCVAYTATTAEAAER